MDMDLICLFNVLGPLHDEMLLGIDFLRAHDGHISCETGTLRVKGILGTIEMSSEINWPVLNDITSRPVRIPPHTAQVIECDLNIKMADFIIELANVFPLGIVAFRT